MIRSISIVQYRKLKNMQFNFNSHINVISGTNGTCKTSLLHMVSNSYKKMTKTSRALKDNACLTVINNINSVTNPKIESLTRGDKKYNDPAIGLTGTLYTINYDTKNIEFRRHNSKVNSRFSVKPYYKKGAKESLPELPIIYLGLTRLYPYGEFHDDSTVKKITQKLPATYKQEINRIYEKLLHIKISDHEPSHMGNVKVRHEFATDKEGIDSNTISAGEDNLFIIITSLVSLNANSG